MNRRYELKLESGKVVEWSGKDGEDAARNYVGGDSRREGVVAHRESRAEYGLAIGVDPRNIIG